MKRLKSNHGFTFVELVIAIGISGIVLAGIYAMYRSQLRSHNTQRHVVEMQQNIRAAMYYLERHIRMAGYDPLRSANAGVGAPFPSPFQNEGGTILANYISLTTDADSDGQIDNSSDDELVAFRLNGSRLEKFSTGAIRWQLIADNIDALNFVYLDGSDPPAPTWDPNQIRSVQVTLVARGGQANSGSYIKDVSPTAYTNQRGDVIFGATNDGLRRIRLSCEVFCRN
jgi:prepilin-type N-terminal cleavage/methylation domain-containing protein